MLKYPLIKDIVKRFLKAELNSVKYWDYESEPVILTRAFSPIEDDWEKDCYSVRINVINTDKMKPEREAGFDLLFSMSYRDKNSGKSYTKFFLAQAKKCTCEPETPYHRSLILYHRARWQSSAPLACLLLDACWYECIFMLSKTPLRGKSINKRTRSQCIKMLEYSSSSFLLILTKECGFFYVPASSVVYTPLLPSCKNVHEDVLNSIHFYYLFFKCFIGEIILDRFFENQRLSLKTIFT